MRVLSLSYCFPSSRRPTWGVFVLQRLAALARRTELQVVSPVPVFPVLSRLLGLLPEPTETHGGLAVSYPRYFYLPRVMKSLDGFWYGRGVTRWMRSAGREVSPDILDAHFVWPDGVGVSRLARRLGLPYAITLRGTIYPCLDEPHMRRQCAEALQGAAVVISVSRPMAAAAAELGVRPERLCVVPNGVDRQRFRPTDKAAARRELDLPGDCPLIVSIAHLKETKGHGETIRALAELGGEAVLVIVGGDVDRGEYRRDAVALIRKLGLDGRVILAGRQDYGRVPLYLNAADVSVLASYREGCPNVVLESLACGTPVVATNVGAVPDLIAPGENGEIVPPRDPAALADALGRVLDRPASAEAVRRSESVKSWDAVADNVLRAFEAALGRDPRPADRP